MLLGRLLLKILTDLTYTHILTDLCSVLVAINTTISNKTTH